MKHDFYAPEETQIQVDLAVDKAETLLSQLGAMEVADEDNLIPEGSRELFLKIAFLAFLAGKDQVVKDILNPLCIGWHYIVEASYLYEAARRRMASGIGAAPTDLSAFDDVAHNLVYGVSVLKHLYHAAIYQTRLWEMSEKPTESGLSFLSSLFQQSDLDKEVAENPGERKWADAHRDFSR